MKLPILNSTFFFIIIFLLFFLAKPSFAALSSIYELAARQNEQMSIRYWIQGAVKSILIDTPLKWVIYGGECDAEKLMLEDGCGVSSLEQLNDPQLSDGRLEGGMVTVVMLTMDEIEKEAPVPTNLAFFINDITDDTLLGSPAYAQDLSRPTRFFQWSTFEIWKISRNIALALSGVILAAAALAVIFRQKINPQATVTIFNVLPYVPIALALIVLSYPIVAIAVNLVPPLFQVALKLGIDVIDAMTNSIAGLGGMVTLSGLVALTMSIITLSFTGIGLALALPLLVMIIGLLIMMLLIFLKYIFEWAKTNVIFIFLVAILPFVGIIGILPGKQKLYGLYAKKILANILVIPIMTFTFLVGLAFILSMGSVDTSPGGAHWTYAFSPNGMFAMIIKFVMGFVIMWKGLGIRKFLEGALGAEGSLMITIQGGGAGGRMERKSS